MTVAMEVVMAINLSDAAVEPFVIDSILGPMMVWPPAVGFAVSARTDARSAPHTEAASSTAICLPDLSAETPFA